MRFASLGSGSRGNATLIEQGGTRLLVDCGFSLRETCRRLERLGCSADALSAILVTHEHSDHIQGVARLAARHRVPVWSTRGSWAAQDAVGLRVYHFDCHEGFAIGDIEVQPFPVPHDAREPAQFVFGDGAVRLGLLTDVGCSTPHIERQLARCEALLLECNHDETLLAEGPYPAGLKRRVGGRYGHLSNRQAAELLQRIDTSRLRHLVAAHLSDSNNTPQHACTALSAALDCSEDWICVADQDQGLGWRQLD